MASSISQPLLPADSLAAYGTASSAQVVPYRSSPSNRRNPIFSHFIQRLVMTERYPEDSGAMRASRLALQVSAIFFAVSAQAGMVNVNLNAANGNEALGGMFATANLATFCLFNSYNSCVLLNDLLRTLSPEEKVLFLSTIPRCVRNTLKVIAAIAGAGSQLPIAYAAYHANDKSLFYFIMRFLDSGVPIRSLYLSGEALYAKRKMTSVEKKLVKANENFCQLLTDIRNILPLLNERSRSQVQAVMNLHDAPVENYLKALIDLAPKNETPSLTYRGVKKATSGVGYLSTFAVMALYWVLSYAAIGLVSDDEGFKIFGATAVMLCNFYLWKDAISQTATQALDRAKQLIQRRYQPTIAESFLPKTTGLLTAAGMTLAAFTFGPNELFSNEYFGRSQVGAKLVEVFSSVGSAFLAQWTFSTFNNAMLEAGLARWGSQDAKNVISVDRQIDRIHSSAQNISIKCWAEFLGSLPSDLKQIILGGIELTDHEISEYLKEVGRPTVEEVDSDEDSDDSSVSHPTSIQEVDDQEVVLSSTDLASEAV